MKYSLSFLYFAALIILSCNNNLTLAQDAKTDYVEYRSTFDRNFTNQFPDDITSKKSFSELNTFVDKNNIGLYLYEYEMPVHFIDSIGNFLDNSQTMAKYKSSDSCLLIVHRFESKNTAENGIIPDISDSSLLDKKCYTNQYPVPNFVNYKGTNSTQCGLDNTFDIYVLEAKKGRYSEKYDLKPFAEMPHEWANGYSKGIAISKKNNVIIYWSIIW